MVSSAKKDPSPRLIWTEIETTYSSLILNEPEISPKETPSLSLLLNLWLQTGQWTAPMDSFGLNYFWACEKIKLWCYIVIS